MISTWKLLTHTFNKAMRYSIKVMEHKLEIDEKKFTGYAFIDEGGHCTIIVYGEKKRDIVKRYLGYERGKL